MVKVFKSVEKFKLSMKTDLLLSICIPYFNSFSSLLKESLQNLYNHLINLAKLCSLTLKTNYNSMILLQINHSLQYH